MGTFIRHQLMQFYEMATGRRMLTRMEELNQSQWFNQAEIMALQRQKLHGLLVYAQQYVPYYHRVFAQANFQPAEVLDDLGRLRKLPMLTKADIHEHFAELITSEPQRQSQLARLSTSGSTGQPVIFMQDNNFRDYFTADVHRHLSWGGWRLGQPHAYIGGGRIDISHRKPLRSRLMNWTLNRFSTNAYVLSEESMHNFAALIRRRKPVMIYGYASSLYYFAQFVMQNNLDDIKFQSVFSSAEVLYPYQRHFIEETFACKVFDRYATRELGEIGSQCEFRNGMHISAESVIIEILDDQGQPAPPGQPGQIIVTNLNNYGMPFIRYNLADRVAWDPVESCPCGRSQRMLAVVEGRHNDMFRTRDGRIVWGGMANPLWDMPGVSQFQLVQKDYERVLVRIVTDSEFQTGAQALVREAIQTVMGKNVLVEFEFPESIVTDKSGKFRYQICEIGDSPPIPKDKPA